jgi:SPOR domain
MIWFLRTIGVRLWLTSLFSIPLGFYFLPGFVRLIPGINPLWILLIMIMGILVLIGFLLDMAAKNMVVNLISDAQAWERAGIHNKAEKKYNRALRLYDSFLLGLFSTKKTARKISAAIARFKLNTSVQNENFSLATAMYLKLNPADEDVAERWLRQVQIFRTSNHLEHEVLTLLAETYYANKFISALINEIFQKSGKKSYVTIKTAQHTHRAPSFAKDYPESLGAALVNPGETLERQKPYYPPETKSERKAKPERVEKPARDVRPKKKIEVGKYILAIAGKAGLLIQIVIRFVGSLFSFLILSVHQVYGFIKEHEKVQFFLKMGVLSIIAITLMVFIVNTMSHMFKSKPAPDEKKAEVVEALVDKPFTIQVSAYLKKEFADTFVNNLKKKDIEATVKKVDGGGKTWFVVRVSEFADKKSADAYGQQLKKQKIIDDFFVTNK